MTHEEAMAAGLAQILDEYLNPPADGSLVPRVWVEERFPATVAAAAEVPEHLRGGWIEDLLTGNTVKIVPHGWRP